MASSLRTRIARSLGRVERFLFYVSVLVVLAIGAVLVGTCRPQPDSRAGAQTESPPGQAVPVAATRHPGADAVATPTPLQRNTSAEAGASTPAASMRESTSSNREAAVDEAQSTAEPTPLPLDRTTNILILGSDRRPRMPNWRTDVIMLLAMDTARKEAAVISLPRDLYLSEIPNHQPNRINVVDYLGEQDEPGGGGPKLLAGILEEKLQIPIHHYVRFDFKGFQKVVDALGGVNVPVDCPIYEYYPEENIYLALEPGEHQLTGAQALSYVRSRRRGGDLERARRQQRVIWAIRRQLVDKNMLPRVPALYAALKDSVQTDIGLITAIRYVRFAFQLKEESVHGMVIGPPDLVKQGWRRGMFVFVADWDQIAATIQTVFNRPPLFDTNTVGEEGDRTRCP